MTELRKTATILLGALALLMGYVALTVPMIAMTGPTILAVAAAGGAWLAWPKAQP